MNTKLKQILLASAFIVSISTAAHAGDVVAVPDGAGGADDIVDASVNAADLGTGSVGTDEIIDGTIATADLADGSVTSAKIVDGTIATADIAAGAVTTASIAADTITAADIATGAVTTDEILNGTITEADLSTGLQGRLAGFDSQISDLKGGVASAIAIANIPGVPTGKQFAVGLGGGTYDGKNAGALKLSFAPQKYSAIQVNASVSYDDNTTGGGVGVSYGF